MNSLRCIWNCTKGELKNVFRMKSIKAILAIIIVYCLYIYTSCTFLENDPWDILRCSSFVPIALMFLFMILGFYLAREEKESNLEEVIASIYKGNFHKFIGKIFALLIIIFSLVFLSMMGVFICYMFKGVSIELYKQSIMYYLIYHIIPFFIEALIGMIIGSFIKNKISYLIMFLIWILTIPLNSFIFKTVMTITSLDLRVAMYFFNLGQYDIHTPIKTMIGLPIESFNLIQRLLILMVVLAIFIIINVRKNKNKLVCIVICFAVAIIPLSISYGGNIRTVKSLIYYGDGVKKDSIYYSNNKVVEDKNNFQIKSCDITLDEKRTEKFITTLKVIPDENVKKLKFSLYNGFNIEKVTNSNNEILKFERDSDFVTVFLKDELKKDDSENITFIYDNESSPLYPVGKEVILLPYDFNYYPSNIIAPAMVSYNSLTRNDLSYECDFTVNITGEKVVYSNLERVSKNKFKGKANGVNLFRGLIKEEEYKNVKYYYPYVASENKLPFENYINNYFEAEKIINDKLNIKLNEKLEKVFFMPINQGSYTEIFHKDNSIIVPSCNNISSNLWFTKEEIAISMITSSLRENIKDENKEYIRDLMNRMLQSYVSIKNNENSIIATEIEFFEESKDTISKTNEEIQRNNINKKILLILEKKDENEFKKLFKTIYDLAKQKDITIKEVEEKILQTVPNTVVE